MTGAAAAPALLAASFSTDVGTPFVQGVINGSVYGLVALGLVLIYKSNKIFSFVQAEFGSVAAIVALALVNGLGVFPRLGTSFFGYATSVVLGVVAGTLVAIVTERLVIRPLFSASRVTLLVATAGVALLLITLELLLVGIPPNFPQLGGARPTAVTLFGGAGALNVTYADLVIIGVLAVLAAVTALFFRTRYGVAILAVSQEPTAAAVVGISTSQISLLTWGLAGFLGSMAGVVLAAKNQIATPGFMTINGPLINGFVAAVVGGMTSLPGAFVGGITIGLVESYAGTLAPSSIPGANAVAVALVLLVVLLVRPTGLLGKET